MTLIFRGHTQDLCPSCSGTSKTAPAHCGACDNTGHEYVEANVLLDNAALVRGLDRKAVEIHTENVVVGWWSDLETGGDLLEVRNRGEMLMLVVTELDEARDAQLGGLKDDKLTHRFGYEVELADAAIRLFDQVGAEQRRGGQQPLITYHSSLREAMSVERAYMDLPLLDVGDRLMWIVGAVAKALDEGYRKDQVRIARYWLTVALFRIIALAAYEDIPLFDIIEEKREYNRNRLDHKVENRRRAGGKKC